METSGDLERSASDSLLLLMLLLLSSCSSRYTLRYSGGLVPDFYHSLIKSSGVFLSPISKSSPAKLRLLYEAACLSQLSIWAGGAAVDNQGNNMADKVIQAYDERSALIIGSKNEVQRYTQFRKRG